jgi:hypothetical protein
MSNKLIFLIDVCMHVCDIRETPPELHLPMQVSPAWTSNRGKIALITFRANWQQKGW